MVANLDRDANDNVLFTIDGLEESPRCALPAKVGIYNYLNLIDPRLGGNDKTPEISTFYDSINIA
jgi:hypothetical protein